MIKYKQIERSASTSCILSGASSLLMALLLYLLNGSCGTDSSTSKVKDNYGKMVKLTIIQTSDLQNRVTGTSPSSTYKTENDQTWGGFSRLATKIKNIRNTKKKENIPVLLFDTGDALSGTLYDMLTENNNFAPALSFFNVILAIMTYSLSVKVSFIDLSYWSTLPSKKRRKKICLHSPCKLCSHDLHWREF